MFIRNLFPFRRALRPCWTTVFRGKRDLPIWRPELLDRPWWRDSHSRSRSLIWDDPSFQDLFLRFGPRSMDEHIKRMDRLVNWSLNRPPGGTEHGINAEVEEATVSADGLYIKMNISHYEADDINVKVMEDHLVISGKHSQKADEHGFVTREFTRELLIPEEVDQETIVARMTDDGYLIISGKVKEKEVAKGRDITIEREDPPS